MATRSQIEAVKAALDMTPEWGKEHVAAAFASDPEAVLSLMVALHDHQRAEMVLLLYCAQVAPAAFRTALEDTWTQTHHYGDVLRAARTWRQFVRWCRYAAFPLPADVPDPVTIHRGGSESEMEGRFVALGPSWTLDREKAEWFACEYAGQGMPPPEQGWLASATVPRSMLMYYSNEREEQEVVPDTLPPPNFAVHRIK